MKHKKKFLFWGGILLIFLFLMLLFPTGYFNLFSSNKEPAAETQNDLTSAPESAATPTAEATTEPTASPTPTATPVPTMTPTPTATPVPTATPTPLPTPTPAQTPTPRPTPTPKPTSTPIPTATPRPTLAPIQSRPLATSDSVVAWAKEHGFSEAVGYGPVPTPTTAPVSFDYNALGDVEDAPAFSGFSCIVADADTGEIFLSAKKDRMIYPASTIKLLTALTALEHGNINRSCTSRAEVLDAIDSDVFIYGVAPNTSYTLDTWMKMLLVASCGDAADTIADCLGGGSKDVFVGWMNEKAQSLGMTHTIVDNPVGLDISNKFHYLYTTADDMLLLSMAAFRNEDVMRYVGIPSFTVPAYGNTPSKELKNNNWLISRSEQYQSNLFTSLGGKTGSTDDAEECLITYAKTSEGRNLVVLYFGAKNKTNMMKEIMSYFTYVCERL